jgi:hypothetical protein
MASYGAYNIAQAANLIFISDTLSDSDLSVTSAHTVAFTIPTGSALTDGDTVTIAFPAGFTGVSSVTGGDVTITVDGTPDGDAVVSAVGQDVTFDTVAATAGQEVIVAIADSIITNPGTAGSYELSVDTGTGGDSGKTRVAIIDNVLVTAIVETTFDFTISGLATSSAVNTGTTTGSTTATAIPFGVLEAGTPEILAQRLNVSTNARNGFSVTVESDSELESSTGAIIDTFTNGTDISTAGTAWAAPTNNINDETTWGHWGMTSDDTDLANDLDAADSYIAVSSTTPREIFSHSGPSDGITQDIGTAVVGYQVEITALQEAGDDYNTTLTYIATPTF